jgi:hypothetical protein
MTPTIVMFCAKRYRFSSEKAAYLWLMENFLRVRPDLLSDPAIPKQRNGRPLLSLSPIDTPDQAKLPIGMYVQTNLSNQQKVRSLDSVAQRVGLKRGRDWEWHAHHQPTPRYIDGDALLAQFEADYRPISN